jgi:hypothetical protein
MTSRLQAWFVALLLLFQGCVVEVGNPEKPDDGSSGEGGKGKLSIDVARGTHPSVQQVYLALTSITLLGSAEPVVIDLAGSERAALIGDDASSVALVTTTDVPAGRYSGMILQLDDGSRSAVVLSEDDERKLQLKNAEDTEIAVTSDIAVPADAATQVTLKIDLSRSLALPSDPESGPVTFDPMILLLHMPVPSKIQGTVLLAEATTVCAYLYELLPPPPPPPGMEDLPPPPPPRSPRGVSAKRPPMFETRQDVIKDESPECPNAFATATVRSGAFVIGLLPPAHYDLRVFTKDGSYTDLADAVALRPGDEAKVTVPAAE